MATPLRRLLPYHDRYKLPFWGGMCGLLAARVFEATIPLFLRDGIDRIASGSSLVTAGSIDIAAARSALAWPALAIVLCVLGEFTCIIFSRRVIRRIGVSVAYDLRKRVYDHLQHQGPGFFARHPTGDLMARAINDINLVRQLVGMGLRTILVIIFSAVVGLLCMFALAPMLTLLLLAPLPVLLVLGWWLARRVYEQSLQVQEGFASLSEQVQENLNGIRTVQALVQEAHEVERFDAVNLDYATRFMTLTRTNSFIQGVMPWVGAWSTVIILGYGGSLVASGEMSIGTFTAFFSYVSMVLWPVRQAGQMVTLWQQGASGAQRLFEVLDHVPEIADRGANAVPPIIRGRIELRALRYAYPGTRGDVLNGIDLDIAVGETIAVLGRVGSGKTTLLRCFVRLLDPPPGTLLIDGYDVRDYPLGQLRHQVVLVPQDPFLFADLLAAQLELRQSGTRRRVDLVRRERRRSARHDRRIRRRPRYARWGTRRHVVGRAEAAFDVDARFDQNAARSDPRRLLLQRRHRDRGTHSAAATRCPPRHDDRARVESRFDGATRRPHRRAHRRRDHRDRQPRRPDSTGRLVCRTRTHAAAPRSPAVGTARSRSGRGMSTTQRDYAIFDAELAGKSFNARLIGRLFDWVRPHWRLAAISGLLVLVASVLAILMPVIVSRVVIDGLLAAPRPVVLPDFGMNAVTNWLMTATGTTHLLAACVLYMIATTAWAIAAHYHRVYLARSVLNALRDLRYDLFSHLETRPASFYDHVAVGRVMTRVTNDIEVLFQLLSGFGVLIGEFVPFLVAFSLMLAIDAKLTGILMLAVPIVAFATYLFRRGTRTVYRAIRQSISQLNQNLQENLSGIQVVQLNRREDRNLARYTQINQENRREENRAVELETFYGAFIDSLGSAAVGAIIWFGGGHALQQTISLGSVVLFTQFVDMLFRPIVAVGEQYNVLFRAMASAERIFQALDWNERIYEPARPAALPARLRGAVDVRNLNFAYSNGPRVLKNVTFHIEPGEKLAIVGATGSGKSTIIRLLARFYDFAPGQMFLDDIDLMEIPSAEVRRRIGIVLQDFHVFSGSVADNISLGNPGISRAQVETRGAAGARTRFHHAAAWRLRRTADRTRPESVARTAATARVRAGAGSRSGNPGVGRSDRQHRHRNRIVDTGRAARLDEGPYVDCDCAPIADDSGGRPRSGSATRRSEGSRHARRVAIAPRGISNTL